MRGSGVIILYYESERGGGAAETLQFERWTLTELSYGGMRVWEHTGSSGTMISTCLLMGLGIGICLVLHSAPKHHCHCKLVF